MLIVLYSYRRCDLVDALRTSFDEYYSGYIECEDVLYYVYLDPRFSYYDVVMSERRWCATAERIFERTGGCAVYE